MVLLCYGCQDEQNAAPYNDFAEHVLLIFLNIRLLGLRLVNMISKLNFLFQLRIANAATKDLQAIHGTKYTCGNSEGILYTACGTSADW